MPRSKSTLPRCMFGSYSTRVVRPRASGGSLCHGGPPARPVESGGCGLVETIRRVGEIPRSYSTHHRDWSIAPRIIFGHVETSRVGTEPDCCGQLVRPVLNLDRKFFDLTALVLRVVGFRRHTSIRYRVLLKCRIPGVDVFTGEAQMATDLVRHRAVPFNTPPVDRLLSDVHLCREVLRRQPPCVVVRCRHDRHLLDLQCASNIDASTLSEDCIDCQ